MRKISWILLMMMLVVSFCGVAGAQTAGSDLVTISCPELGFTTMADPAYAWAYEEGTGIYIYTDHEGSIPYVLVWQDDDLLGDPLEYIQEQCTPYMQKQYGGDLVSFKEYEAYSIGGKTLPAGLYTYRLQGELIDMLRLYDCTGSRTVAYSAKYVQGQGEETLAALDVAIRHFNSETGSLETEAAVEPDEADLVVAACAPWDSGKFADIHFSTMVDSSYPWKTDHKINGIRIFTGEADDFNDCVSIECWGLHDEVYKTIRRLTVKMQAEYDVVDYAEYGAYDIGGRQLPAAMYTYNSASGELLDEWTIYDSVDGCTVEFKATFRHGKGNAAYSALETAIRHFSLQQDSKEIELANDDLTAVYCSELGFSTMVNSSHSWTSNNIRLTIFTEAQGASYVDVWPRAILIDDPFKQIQEFETPYMQENHDLADYEEHEDYEIGGKELPAGLYTYRDEQGQEFDQLILYDSDGERTVIYTALYVHGEGDATLKALDAAVRFYKTEPNSAEADADLATVSCPELGFTTLADSSYASIYDDKDFEFFIYTEEEGELPYVEIARSYVSDPYEYIMEDWIRYLKRVNHVVETEVYKAYNIGGKQLPTAMITYYDVTGKLKSEVRAYDQIDGHTYRFYAISESGMGDAALEAMDTAIRHFKLDSASAEPALDDVDLISMTCPDMGYTTMVDPSYAWTYDEHSGIVISTGSEGGIPRLSIQMRLSKLAYPFEYIQGEWTPSMLDVYDVFLVDYAEYEAYDVGGKILPAALYTYSVDESVIDDLWIFDATGEHTIVYDAKYVQGEGDATLAALDNAVRYAQMDQKGILAPMDLSRGGLNMEGGIYRVEMPDAGKMSENGYFTLSLYEQDRYTVSGIEALSAEERVRVDMREFTVADIKEMDDGLIEVIPQEDFSGKITFRNEGDFYTAMVDGKVPCSFAADYQITLPLTDHFRFIMFDEARKPDIYEGESFVDLMTGTDAPTVTPYNTSILLQDDQSVLIVHNK